RLASVIRRSTSGAAALAFASVVLIRSWSITSRARFMKSALRCEALRDSLRRSFWWRIAAPPARSLPLGGAQVQPARLERLDDLFDRLAAEVRDRVQLGLRLLQQVAHGLDAGALEAVVGPHAQLELLDEDVVHPVRGAAGPRTRGNGLAEGVAVGAQLLQPVGVGEDRQRLDEDLGGLAQRGLRGHRTVGLDVERELVVVGALADSRRLHVVGDSLDRREDRVDRDHADRLVGRLVLLGWGV